MLTHLLTRRTANSLCALAYHSRAHPQPHATVDVTDAIAQVLQDAKRRKRRRSKRLSRRGANVEKPFVHPDETVELAVNLNVDPKRPGQALRGSFALPHGSGKKQADCIVFTDDPDLQQAALAAGAKHAGGSGLVDEIAAGRVSVESGMKSLATADIMPVLSKKVARLLGPRGLMPNAKEGTLVSQPDHLLPALETQLAGKEVSYRTEREGIVHVPVGKASFGPDKILENVGEVMRTLFSVKPEIYGKGKKQKTMGKGTKYLLQASITSTQGKGYRLNLPTVDPTSLLFLQSTTAAEENSNEQ